MHDVAVWQETMASMANLEITGQFLVNVRSGVCLNAGVFESVAGILSCVRFG